MKLCLLLALAAPLYSQNKMSPSLGSTSTASAAHGAQSPALQLHLQSAILFAEPGEAELPAGIVLASGTSLHKRLGGWTAHSVSGLFFKIGRIPFLLKVDRSDRTGSAISISTFFAQEPKL